MSGLAIYHQLTLDENAPIRYISIGDSLCMHKHENPLSIKHKEFDYLMDFIIKNKLKTGYEVATAFGISSLAIGLGMSQTGGRVVTMDAYIEETKNACDRYKGLKEVHQQSDGLTSVTYLIDKHNLQKVIFPKVGWSPDDTHATIASVYDQGEKLDFVFIDAGHWDEAVLADLKSVLPFLAEKHAIFLHDVHCFSDKVDQFLIETFGKTYEIVVPLDDGGYNLALINNL